MKPYNECRLPTRIWRWRWRLYYGVVSLFMVVWYWRTIRRTPWMSAKAMVATEKMGIELATISFDELCTQLNVPKPTEEQS